MNIIDVSEHQGKIDWKKVKGAGIEGVIIRAGYGRNNIDKQLKNNLKGAVAQGMNIGIYWFSYAYNSSMVANEAHYCAEAIKDYKEYINLPVFFDWEYDSMKFAKKNGVNPSRQNITDWQKVFCENIKELGYTAGFYTNLDYSKNYIDCSQLTDYKLWWAQYTKKQQKNNYLWQYSSSGSVAGISGNVDMNILWSNPSENPQEPAVEPSGAVKKTNEEIAREVWQGKWGDGEERKKRLTEAGYDYKAIQKIVDATKPKTNEEIAKEVWEGKWGNGADRKKKLTEAGYNYDAIQKLVDDMKPKKTNEELADEVWQGKWGDGEDRKKNLTEAGYDYDAVQKIVEQAVGGYYKGKTYTVLPVNGLNLRSGAGKGSAIRGVLKKGTKVTPINIVKNGDSIWMYNGTGWMCAREGNKVFIQ